MTDFPLPPANMLGEQIVLADHRLALGLLHPEGRDLGLGAWDGEFLRYLTLEAARKYAADIESGPFAEGCKAVTEALRHLADRADDIATQAMFRRAAKTAARALKYGTVH